MKTNMRMLFLIVMTIATMTVSARAEPATYHVALWGSDANDGTASAPFRTIQYAADTLAPGQVCVIHAGRYRETVTLTRSGSSTEPITFVAAPGEEVVIDGTDPIASEWHTEDGRLYTVALNETPEQVFFDNNAMMCARWPNMSFDENWEDTKKWGRSAQGSARGMIVEGEFSDVGESLRGAKIFVKIGKGNNGFSRDVIAHEAGHPELYWDDSDFYDAPRLTGEDGRSERIEAFGLHNNRFFVFNHRALLDAEHEWYYNPQSSELLFIPPGGGAPAQGRVTVKRRVYGFTGDNVEFISLRGIAFFACTASFTHARHITVEESRFFYPYELLAMRDNRQIRDDQRPVSIQGENCVLRKCLVKYAPGPSVQMIGRGNRIENCIVTEGSRHGRHGDPNITLQYDSDRTRNNTAAEHSGQWQYSSQEGNTIARSTIFNGSGIGIYLLGRGPGTAEYNHVFNVGRYCTDVSALYIPLGSERAWTGFHHNWVHDINGIGIRCDQDGQQVLFHHNVIWNCKAGGKANGYAFKIFNNTIAVDNPQHPLLLVKQKQIKVVDDWPIQNNVLFRLADRIDLREWQAMSEEERGQRDYIADVPESATIHHNHSIKPDELPDLFVRYDEESIDLRPAAAGPLIDRGIHIAGINDGFVGMAPDIGAYEYGGDYWTAGADWWPDGLTPPKTMDEATQRAHQLTRGVRLYREDQDAYEKQ